MHCLELKWCDIITMRPRKELFCLNQTLSKKERKTGRGEKKLNKLEGIEKTFVCQRGIQDASKFLGFI